MAGAGGRGKGDCNNSAVSPFKTQKTFNYKSESFPRVSSWWDMPATPQPPQLDLPDVEDHWLYSKLQLPILLLRVHPAMLQGKVISASCIPNFVLSVVTKKLMTIGDDGKVD